MSPDVRVHVRLGSVRLDYQGDQAFYEAKVESLVAAAAMRGPQGFAMTSPPEAAVSTPAPARESVGPPALGRETAPRTAGAAPTNGFVPQSSEFGRYIKRLGPEAGEPDRQVVAMAFYLWNYERRETFGRAELTGCFKAVGLPPPEGLDGILSDLTERKRFLEPAGEATWRLSKKGENYVKTRLLSV